MNRAVALTLLAVLCAPVCLFAEPGEYDTRVRGYWVDPSTGLMWAGRDNFGRDVNWHQADKYCRDLQLAGYRDWRLPQTNELESIYDRSASTQGLRGKHNESPMTWHVKGDIFLTGYAWSGSGFIDSRDRFRAWGVTFDFNEGRRNGEELGFHTFKRALCVRGEVIVDLTIPTRYTGVDVAARKADYLEARLQCEVAVFTGVRWRGAEPRCRRLVEWADRLPGDAVLERVNALGMHAVALASEGRLTESLTSLDLALSIRPRHEDDAYAADLQVIAAQIRILTGDAVAATALFESAIATYEREIARSSSAQEQYRRRLAAIRQRFAEVKVATAHPSEPVSASAGLSGVPSPVAPDQGGRAPR